MKLVLAQNIRGLGSTGDVVTVKDGYARNYLLPKKLATYPHEDNIKRLKKEREGYLLQERDRIEAAEILAAKVRDVAVTISMKANEAGQLFGSVTETIVAEAVTSEIGVEIHASTVALPQHFKRIGEYVAALRLHSEVEIEMPIVVVAEGADEDEDGMMQDAEAEAPAADEESAPEATEEAAVEAETPEA